MTEGDHMPEELALAAHYLLDTASLADVQSFVDRRVVAGDRLDGPRLELCDLRNRDSRKIVGLLEAVSSVSREETRAAWLAVATLRAWERGRVPTSRAVAFINWIASSLGALGPDAYRIADMFADATHGLYGTVENVEREMRDLERELSDRLATSSTGREP